jgi:hypothetical protein
MAKAKVTKVKKIKKAGSKNKTAFVGLGIVLVCVGIMLFALQSNGTVIPAGSRDLPKSPVQTDEPTVIGPSQGCDLIGTSYKCDIKINNPKPEPLAWSAIITGLDGATFVEGNSGTVAQNGSTIVKLSVPKAVCETDLEAKGTVIILEDKQSSNQDETQFACDPLSN